MIEYAIMITTKDPASLTGRLRQVEESLGLPFGFIHAVKNDRDREDWTRGCFAAHKKALLEFLKTGKDNCLILEDDVYFTKSINQVDIFSKFEDIDWEVIYLGHRPVSHQSAFVKRTQENGVLLVHTNDTHALIVSKTFARRLAQHAWCGIPIDVLVRINSEHCYALYPMLAIQIGAPFTASFWNGYLEKSYEYIRYSKTCNFFIRYLRITLFPVFATTLFLWILGIAARYDRHPAGIQV